MHPAQYVPTVNKLHLTLRNGGGLGRRSRSPESNPGALSAVKVELLFLSRVDDYELVVGNNQRHDMAIERDAS